MTRPDPTSAPIRSQITAVNLMVAAVTLLLALGTTLGLTLYQASESRDSWLINSAQMLAKVPLLSQTLLGDSQAAQEVAPFLDQSIQNISDIDVIALCDAQGRLFYYPNRDFLGTDWPGREHVAVLEGAPPFASDDTGPSGVERCAYAPVLDRSGEILGFVMVGIDIRSLSHQVLRAVVQFLAVALVALGAAALLSKQLSKRIKDDLLGYEPSAISQLFHQREDILNALEEGVLAIGADKNVLFINRAAAAILSLDPLSSVGRSLKEVYPRSTLDRILTSRQTEYNVPLRSLKRVSILSDRFPLYQEGKVVGAVAIFRNRTELTRMAADLTGVRHMVEAMRAYTHEFMNKLHVILGLLQIGEVSKAQEYIMDVTRLQQESVNAITQRIEPPAVAALLVGKTSRAAELGIVLHLDPTSRLELGEEWLPLEAYVTILGNLIENAVDALNQSPRPGKTITVTLQSQEDGLRLCVEDNGPGMSLDTARKIFQPGFSTKGQDRGTGLILVQEVVEAYQGQIRVESEPGVGTTVFVTFHFEREKECSSDIKSSS